MPAVSVVIPAYNAERYLGETLDSVLAQTYRDFEVVVVDDGSTDSTRDIVASYGEPVRCIEQANAGPSAARNHGVREARGEAVAFVDSDDLWMPEKLAHQMPLFDAEGRVGLVYSEAERMASDGSPIPTTRRTKPQGDVFLDLLVKNHCPTSAVVVRRECFLAAGGFPEDMVWAEDWCLWLRIARRWQFRAVQEVLVRHRVHAGALTGKLSDAYLGAREVLARTLEDTDGPEVRATVRRGYHRIDRDQALLWLGLGDLAPARRCFWSAIRNGPTDPHVHAGLLATLVPGPVRRPLLGLWKRTTPWVPWTITGRIDPSRMEQ